MAGFEVVGYEEDDDYDDDDDGEVEGSVMGYEGPMAVVGYDDYGQPIVGARRKRRRRRAKGGLVRVKKAHWRQRGLAPGVEAPDQGMLTLPLAGRQGNQFTAAIPQIIFEGQAQKPFRPERLLVTTVRTGATAVGRLTALIFNGTDLQQLDINPVDIEQIGDPTAFGVRLTTTPVQPGVFVRLVTTLTTPLTAPDTIDVTIQVLGRAIH